MWQYDSNIMLNSNPEFQNKNKNKIWQWDSYF